MHALEVLFLTVFSFHWCLFTQALFLLLFKSFSNVLADRLPKGSGARTLHEWKSAQVEEMVVDLEEPSTMEVDNENQIPQNRFPCLSLSYQDAYSTATKFILWKNTIALY